MALICKELFVAWSLSTIRSNVGALADPTRWALQLTDGHTVATPDNWRDGDDVTRALARRTHKQISSPSLGIQSSWLKLAANLRDAECYLLILFRALQ